MHTSFVTLTYDKDNVDPNGSLVPRDLQLFLKRLRRNSGESIRYFAVGEYGDLTWRPHYHLAMFGVGAQHEEVISTSWGRGIVDVANLEFKSAQYIAGYVTKKLTDKDHYALEGRYPEFARMSLRPGIGASAIDTIAEALRTPQGRAYVEQTGDVPNMLKHGTVSYPIGPYLRAKLRLALDRSATEPEALAYARTVEMSVMLADFKSRPKTAYVGFKQALQEIHAQKILQVEGRAKLYSKVSKL